MPTSLGLVGITNKGTYDAQTPYVKGNFVYHNGSTWLLIANTATGIEPNENNSATWQYLAKGFNVLPFAGATAQTDGTGGTVPQPHAGDQDKVLQGSGAWGHKLQLDVVKQGNEYGYINSSNEFVAFKSQADIDAAVSAAKVGNATAADVLSGKTFTNSTTSGVTGTMPSRSNGEAAVSTDRANGIRVFFPRGHYPNYATHDGQSYVTLTDAQVVNFANKQEKTVTATDSTIAVTPDSGKLLSKVNVNPKLRFQGGRLNNTRKNIDGWNDTWTTKTWNGLTNFDGRMVWTDGDNIYYSYGTNQYILNKSTSTWSTKTWNGLTNFSGKDIWSDGTNIYYSYESSQYVLNKSTSTWSTKTWNGEGIDYIVGSYIWTDGSDIYNTDRNNRTAFKLDISTSTWSWFASWSVKGDRIWTDGTNIYYGTTYVYNKSTHTWSNKTWSGTYPSTSGCSNIWTDGDNIYYSSLSTQYILNKATLTWSNKTWSGLTNFDGIYMWTDGDNIYYSSGTNQKVLNKVKTHWVV